MKQSYYFLFILFLICFTSKLYSQSVPSYVPTNGLVGWWGFNGNAQDDSGNGNHGTINGVTLTNDLLIGIRFILFDSYRKTFEQSLFKSNPLKLSS